MTFDEQDLWTSGEGGYVRYRIPALLTTKGGTILAFCEARKHTGRDSDQIDLYVRRSEDGGHTFGGPALVARQEDFVCGNPAPVCDRDTGTIWLLITKNHREVTESDICRGKGERTVWITRSDDDGFTWSEPAEITRDVKRPDWTWYATGPCHGIQLRSGRLVIPCDHIVRTHGHRYDPYYSHIIFSDDHGENWQIGGSADEGTNESAILETVDGRLYFNCRNKKTSQINGGGHHRAVTWSSDQGESFSPVVHDVALPEPICQASVLRYPSADGRTRALFSNPACRTARSTMTVRLSYDECRTWPISRVLYRGSSAYSDLCVAPDGAICCLYESGTAGPYERLTLARFDLEWLTRGVDIG